MTFQVGRSAVAYMTGNRFIYDNLGPTLFQAELFAVNSSDLTRTEWTLRKVADQKSEAHIRYA